MQKKYCNATDAAIQAGQYASEKLARESAETNRYMKKLELNKKDQHKQAFENWLEDEGMQMNPEGFEHAFSNHHYLSPAQFDGMNLWLEDFRKLFTPAPLK